MKKLVFLSFLVYGGLQAAAGDTKAPSRADVIIDILFNGMDQEGVKLSLKEEKALRLARECMRNLDEWSKEEKKQINWDGPTLDRVKKNISAFLIGEKDSLDVYDFHTLNSVSDTLPPAPPSLVRSSQLQTSRTSQTSHNSNL